MIRTVAIVSLSSGVLGEGFIRHELEIGMKRLAAYGLDVRFMPHALKGIGYLRDHPEARAADLLQALRDPEIDMILCAIGGDDTYRLLPHLFEHDELQDAVNDKVFLGFSDTTINHLMLHKVGMRTFYGQSFLADICELSDGMLPYTRRCFEELIATGGIRAIEPSDAWYESRESRGGFDADQIGVPLVAHENDGFELLQGEPEFTGKILGGCLDSLFDIFDASRHSDMPDLCARYGIFPSSEEWRGRILLLETSEEKMAPEKYRRALGYLKDAGVFDAISGVLVGKPMDGCYEQEYRRELVEIIDDPSLPVVCNINVGHAMPRCIIPFGIDAHVDVLRQSITFEEA